jgi:pimeloyl-ACP methyl ester carboxylesterase
MSGLLVTTGLVLVPGCGSNVDGATIPDVDAGEAGSLAPAGVGGTCADDTGCRAGLACQNGTCQPGHSLDNGAACVISDECKDTFYCASGKCAAAGKGAAGDTCSSDADCKSTFRCDIVGFNAQCEAEGNKDVGGQCATNKDCFAGLLCANKVCAPPPSGGPAPLAIPGFKGVDCGDTAPSADADGGAAGDGTAVSALFHVPRGQNDGDFFRLPFPNDIRKKDGKLDLTGFPTPGADLLGFDLVDRWARFLEQTGSGWSVYPTVTFRFSGEIDYQSLNNGGTKWVDLTAAADLPSRYNWSATSGRTQYVCPNSLSFRVETGKPLAQGHTYAVLVTNATKAKDGSAIGASDDLTAVLGATDPGGDLSKAFTAYAPLRTWATSTTFDLKSVINAAVFTVGTPATIGQKLYPAVAAATAPTAANWVKCGAAPSPCAQAQGDRACPAAADPKFDELHALVTLPLFQKGKLPFLTPDDGGDLVLDPSGQPTAQGPIQVCMAVTIPKGATMPATGWPLVVYAHGTGGSFRSAINEGVAARLADAEGQKFATLGIDQVGHGTRRGDATDAPQNIFFNFGNPAAARGNVLQGAADQMSLVRFAKGLTLAAASSPTGADIKFGNIAFWGHSQGATEGSIAMPYQDGVVGAVFSGVGASLIDALLTKKSPINLAAVAPAILSEFPANVTSVHPALAMFQNAIDPADPLDHAGAIIAAGAQAKHVFVPYGQNDTYAPPITQQTYVIAAKLGVATQPASVTNPDKLSDTLLPVPAGANAAGFTAIVREYTPTTYDGHFVAYDNPDAKTDVDRFFEDALQGIAPKIGR